MPRPALPGAVAYMAMTFNIGRSLGPALGGLIVGAAGAIGAFAFNAFTYLPVISVLFGWKAPAIDTSLPRERILHAMAAGVRYTMMSPDILRVIPRAALFGFGIAAVSGLMPVIAREQLGGGPLTFGLLLGAYGLGSVAAGFVVRPMLERFGSEKVVILASLSAITGTVAIAFSQFTILSMIALLFVGVGWVLALSACNTVIQLAAPRWVVARTLAIYQMAAYGAMASGAASFGVLADHVGILYSLLAASSVHLASILIGRALPIVDIERDLDPYEWSEPDLALPIEGRSGPIVISIAYEIAEENVSRFIGLMAERRRVRRRDGAHDWTLMRDLNSPTLWVERYDVATWHDYIRHNRRHTVADTQNWHEILALHLADEPPMVHRLIERQTANLPGPRQPTAREMSGFTQT